MCLHVLLHSDDQHYLVSWVEVRHKQLARAYVYCLLTRHAVSVDRMNAVLSCIHLSEKLLGMSIFFIYWYEKGTSIDGFVLGARYGFVVETVLCAVAIDFLWARL